MKNSTINWISASKVEVLEMQVEKQYEPVDYAENLIFPGHKLKLIRSERALHDLQMENYVNIVEAESQHSDLIPAKYEGRSHLTFKKIVLKKFLHLKIAKSFKSLYQGGLKIWECSYDLIQYLFQNNVEFQGKFV